MSRTWCAGCSTASRNVRFRQADVTGVDWDERTVLLEGHAPLPFDHLVLAGGATVTHFGTPGAAEHGFALYTLADAVRLRNHIVERFETADADGPTMADGELTFVVVGGGPTGVETAGALVELFAMVFRKDYPELDVSRARVVLVEMQDHLLGPFGPRSRTHALDTLTSRGVEVRLGATVAEVTDKAVVLRDGEVLPCRTLVWAAGVQANPLGAALGLEQARGGRLVVGPDLRVPGREGVWAIGDIAAATDRRRRGAPAARARRDAGRPSRRPPDHPPGRGQGHRAVPLPRTRGRWPRSVAAPRWPSSPAASTCAAAPRGWRGSGCTSCSSSASATARRCSSTGPGTTSPGTAALGSCSGPGSRRTSLARVPLPMRAFWDPAEMRPYEG